jgi:molybdenum cofactor cytidylyltransferase
MAASLRAGLAALPPDTAAAFVFLGDMPAVPHGLARRLAQALDERGAAAAAPTFHGERGHPALFAAELFAALRGLRGDQGARTILDALGPRLALVETADPGVRFDIDTAADLTAGRDDGRG